MKEIAIHKVKIVNGGAKIELINGISFNIDGISSECAKSIEYSLNSVLWGYITTEQAQQGIAYLPCDINEKQKLSDFGLIRRIA